MKKLMDYTLEQIKCGYLFDRKEGKYTCLLCGRAFLQGEIFPFDSRFFDAEKAVILHIAEEHGDMLNILLDGDKKETGLTDVQKELVRQFYAGRTDKEIAQASGVAPATVRYQRFSLRERAKQARLLLAIVELMEEGMAESEDAPVVHPGATMVDERYMATAEDEKNILAAHFSSLSPLRLINLSSKEKKKIVILRKIAGEFEQGQEYTEKEINATLKEINDDYVTLRRYLIEYGFMERTTDCSKYWLKNE